MGWFAGFLISVFACIAIFARWIANDAPGSVHDLREEVGVLLKIVNDPEQSLPVEVQQQSRQLRLLLLSLPVNYSADQQDAEDKLIQLSDSLSKAASSTGSLSFQESTERLEELVSSRQDHWLPILSVGPGMPSPDQRVVLASPSAQHWFGTDQSGRDVLARLVHGLQNALFFSLAVVLVCLAIGIVLGGLMGFYGGWVDLLLSRVMEIIGNFPIFLLQLTFLAYVDPSYGILLFVMCFSGWIPYCRFVRAEFLKLREQEFVQAARVLGASKLRIFFRHLIPNSLTPVITFIPFDLSSTIIALGALSFIGFGEPIDSPSIGELLRQAQRVFQSAWWLAFFPGFCLFLLTLSLTLFGSAIRDHLDPRFKA
jgi:ABC-type dipeptide/oligopeptide/nickel transport system permease subunit